MPSEQTWINPKAKVQTSTIEGKGLFALSPISIGEVVVRWGGTYVSKEEALAAQKSGKLIMQWDDDLYSVEDRGEEDGYFINHSCDSNLWMNGAYELVARKQIPAGVELTADYALWEARPRYISSWTCACGKSNCRQKVTGLDWQNMTLQKKYKDHFTPLINKRIAGVI